MGVSEGEKRGRDVRRDEKVVTCEKDVEGCEKQDFFHIER